jgi:cell cycle sensor histidine kinase DivJ
MVRAGSTSSKRRQHGDAAGGLLWHAGWALAIALAGGGLAANGLLDAGPTLLALAAGGAAAGLGAILSLFGGPGRMAAVLAWGLAGATACHLTGGIAGPLAAWCLAPAAAATAFRSRELLALGGAAALAAAAVSALDTALLTLPPVEAATAPWLSLMALATVTLGFASGLVGFQGASQRDARRRERADQILELLQSQPLLLASLDRSGRVLSAAGATVADYGPRQLEGRSLGHLVAESELPALAAALHAATKDGYASLYAAPNGAASSGAGDGWLEITLKATLSGRIIAAVRDAREQFAREKRLEAERFTAEQQNAGKSRFLANMSHELRTPLNAIMGFSDIMRQRLFGPMGDRYAEYSELIHESGTHLLELINDVLDMSKIEAERFELSIEAFDARDAIAAVLRLMRGQADRSGVHLRGVLPIAPLQADADRRAVKQIALNLISNALKFTPRNGSVTVTVQGHGDTLELIVADTGVGIAQDDLDRLGRPFEQAGDAEQRASGSGLGLSLVRAFARLHGGDMVVESSVGEGTTVTVRLPVLAEDATIQPAPLRRNG